MPSQINGTLDGDAVYRDRVRDLYGMGVIWEKPEAKLSADTHHLSAAFILVL